MQIEHIEKALSTFLPPKSVPFIAEIIVRHRIHLHISQERKSKNADYRPPQAGKGHKITINHSLNPYAFLVTMLHEIAHLYTFEKHRGNVKPHGQEWKHEFSQLLTHFIELGIFPHDIQQAIHKNLKNPKASSCTDPQLFKALSKYNTNTAELVFLDELITGDAFEFQGRLFIKKEKLRKFHLCQEHPSGITYRISGNAQVKPCELPR